MAKSCLLPLQNNHAHLDRKSKSQVILCIVAAATAGVADVPSTACAERHLQEVNAAQLAQVTAGGSSGPDSWMFWSPSRTLKGKLLMPVIGLCANSSSICCVNRQDNTLAILMLQAHWHNKH
jgi:hypothetical protein